MGKLIEKLNRVGSTSGARLGFGMGSDAKKPGMLLVARIDTSDEATAKAATSGGADAVLVSKPSAKKTKTALAKSLGVADTVAVGGYAAVAGSGEVAGWDFAVVAPGDAVGVLADAADLDRVLQLPLEVADETLRALQALPVDSVAIEVPTSALQLKDLVPIYRVVHATRKPVMAQVSIDADRPTLLALRDAGIVGLITTVTTGDAKGLKALYQTVLDLPPKKSRAGKGAASPALGLSAHAAGADDDVHEDDGDYEDDED